jgi:hemolysin III
VYQKLRDPVSGLMHLGAAAVAALGLLLLVYLGRDSFAKQISLFVYGLSLVAMFSASATYHLVNSKPDVMKFLRKIDHSAIYFLIAGTYTPICLFFFTGFYQWGILAIVWTMAAVGITVKLFWLNAPRWITVAIYLVMGWLGILAIREMLTAMPVGAIVWLVSGGLFFTVGAVVYGLKKPDWYPGVFGFHELWHIFVILGCLCHFILIAAYIAPVAMAA